jgi:fructokinase
MNHKPVIVGLGEVLWDVFPDGPRFGGAPANFVCSVAGLGQDQFEVAMASSVGNDELGRRALDQLRQHGVDVSAVTQLDAPTGQVHVSLDPQGHASYEFASNTAWDHLAWSDTLERLARRADVVCFGTLGQRSDASKQTIRQFVSSTPPGSLRLLDVNLRSPYWNEEVILQSLSLANALKLNDAELPVIAGLLKLQGTDEAILEQILRQHSLRIVALTRGAKGSLLIRADGTHSDLAGQPVAVVDTVGAGDAFTAAMAIGVLRELSLQALHRWASDVAAYVCTQAGATPELPASLAASGNWQPPPAA